MQKKSFKILFFLNYHWVHVFLCALTWHGMRVGARGSLSEINRNASFVRRPFKH